MTRHKGFVVTLADDVRGTTPKIITACSSMVRGVIDVRPAMVDFDDHAKPRAHTAEPPAAHLYTEGEGNMAEPTTANAEHPSRLANVAEAV